jgi:integrase
MAILEIGHDRRAHLADIIIIAADTGLRRGELLSLTWEDIDFDARQINVRAQNAKDNEARSIPMTARVYESLQRIYKRILIDRRAHLSAIIIISADTGLRRGELLLLSWGDIDFDSRQVNVRAQNAKDNEARSISMTARVFDSLQRLYAKNGNHRSGLVFAGLKDPKKSFNTACRLKKINDLRLDDYRHAFVTRCILAGIPRCSS